MERFRSRVRTNAVPMLGRAGAQPSEVKEKPTLYTYVADWNIPWEGWADMEKADAPTQKLMDKAIADGTTVGYGNDVTLVYQGTESRTTIGGRPCLWPACLTFWIRRRSPAVGPPPC